MCRYTHANTLTQTDPCVHAHKGTYKAWFEKQEEEDEEEKEEGLGGRGGYSKQKQQGERERSFIDGEYYTPTFR